MIVDMPTATAEYKNLVEKDLAIKPKFFDDHWKTIRDRLLQAHAEMVKVDHPSATDDGTPKLMLQDAIYGINHCIHLASSLALLGSVNHIRDGIAAVHRIPKLRNVDPTTILTIATLHYLLNDFLLKPNPKPEHVLKEHERRAIEDIYARFRTVNWMIGTDAMSALGI